MTGCSNAQQEQATMTAQATRFIQIQNVNHGVVQTLNHQFAVGLLGVSNSTYTDTNGVQQEGLVARISIADRLQTDPEYRAPNILVHEGSIFEADGRYEVIELHKGSSNGMPGSNSSYMVFGKLAD
ncbi:hypothetical protein [Herpetosiphon llansteffanensis]|uniref:hypothetical protein n=1 Tax=Herpetosiphon llansteffanensis TaxID=2094568 RepID=UPI000F519FA5|nr:hypothetical protein [Herpetosiphon llansteffanensis]